MSKNTIGRTNQAAPGYSAVTCAALIVSTAVEGPGAAGTLVVKAMKIKRCVVSRDFRVEREQCILGVGIAEMGVDAPPLLRISASTIGRAAITPFGGEVDEAVAGQWQGIEQVTLAGDAVTGAGSTITQRGLAALAKQREEAAA